VSSIPPSAASLRGAVDLSSLVNKPATRPGSPAGESSKLVVDATDATFTSILELSNSVPVVVEFYGQGVEPTLASLVSTFGGRLVLATVDGTRNPQLVQAFQVTEVPTVAAVVGGRPVQLFVGMPGARAGARARGPAGSDGHGARR
jgi:putative thioredoxin